MDAFLERVIAKRDLEQGIPAHRDAVTEIIRKERVEELDEVRRLKLEEYLVLAAHCPVCGKRMNVDEGVVRLSCSRKPCRKVIAERRKAATMLEAA